MTDVTTRPMRSDARRNRERVLAAAESVFSEMGLRAQIEEVARRAGVGVGTVCRHFPTKQALVEAVLEAMYESLLHDARRALQSSPTPAPRSTRSSWPLLGVPGSPPRARRAHGDRDRAARVGAVGSRRAARRDRRARDARAGGRARSAPTSARPTSRCSSPASRTRPRSPAISNPCCASATSRSCSTGSDRSRRAGYPARPLDFAQLQRIKKSQSR